MIMLNKAIPLIGMVAGALFVRDGSAKPKVVLEPTLVARAVLPAETFAPGPTSGTLLGAGPINGVAVPFVDQQPVQGFSAVLDNRDGTFLAMADNGFGAQTNSADFNLRVYTIEPDFATAHGGSGTIDVVDFIELNDRDGRAGFELVNEASADRILTGADFDIESMQRDARGDLWIGDEFGPFILHFDPTGRLLQAPIPLPNFAGEGFIRAPQNPFLGPDEVALAQTSGGFEGMALTCDGKRLLPLLERPLSNTSDRVLLIHEFDIASSSYTGVNYLYPLEDRGVAIGDFIMVNTEQGLVIERDGTQGDLGGFKAIFQIELGRPGELVRKTLLVDLMNIADPFDIADDVAGDVGVEGTRFAFPFTTIEDVVILNRQEIGIINDNNFPFSIGRHTGAARPDDSEFIVVRLPDALRRR